MNFSHLHVHTTYSVLDGMAKVEELIDEAKAMGHTAIGITDHGSTSALFHAQQYGDSVGIKVILGTEFYIEREIDGKNGHVLVFAKDQIGLQNLFQLQEVAYVHNFYRKPRINFDLLKQYKQGLIITSACIASDFGQYIMSHQTDKAFDLARRYKKEFGSDFFLEIQPNEIPEQLQVNRTLLAIGKQVGIGVIATNDVHYVRKDDSFPHEVLLAMQIKKKMNDESRWKFDTEDFWLKDNQEMIDTFHGIDKRDIISSMDMTGEIVRRCNARIEKGKYLPKFYDVKEGETERSLLAKRIMEGAKEKKVNNGFMKEVQDELNVIDRNGYSGYFLIVSDYVNTARNNGILVGDGRGSGAGSKVAWLTGITKIRPDTYNLLFERFLADGREPDFDVDFSDQDAVFDDLAQKYGQENVARVIAFGTMTPKAVCRKVFSTFDHPMDEVNYVAKQIPDACTTMQEAYGLSTTLQNLRSKYPVEFNVVERLEGVISHESQHAGGIIIYPELSKHLPVKTRGEDRTKRIVAFDKYMLEDLGHFKFDVLGLATLPVLKETLDSIKEHEGEEVDLYSLNYDDPKVYDMLKAGDVSGVFQLANQAQKVMEQKPDNFLDLIAINALIRPGIGDWEEYIARRKGKKYYLHPHRTSYMEETQGIITYQEQFLLDAKMFARWEIAYADKKIRKNKDIRNDVDLMTQFVQNGIAVGYPVEVLQGVWAEIVEAVAGGYSFNKSHSASYAMISFQTAYLKCHYPIYFYSALMTSEKSGADGQDMISQYIYECKDKGIPVLPPDINKSGDDFLPTKDGILYRLTAIKHVGESAITSLHMLRPIKSFADLLERREKRHVRKNVIISLIKAGCFDFDEPDRGKLMWLLDMDGRSNKQVKDDYQCPTYEYNDRIKANWEKEVLGVYLSLHPMEKYGFKPLDTFPDGGTALQGGEVHEIRIFKDKNKNEMCFAFLSTLFGNLKIIIFSNTWSQNEEEYREMLTQGSLLMVKGRRSGNDLLVDSIKRLEDE